MSHSDETSFDSDQEWAKTPKFCIYEAQCREEFFDEWSTELIQKEKEIRKLEMERNMYRRSFQELLIMLNEVLLSENNIPNVWSNLVSDIDEIDEVYGGAVGEQEYDIWVFLKENSLDAKIAIAKAEGKIHRIFPNVDFEFKIYVSEDKTFFEIPIYLSKIL